MHTTAIPIHALASRVPEADMSEKHPMGPTRPHVPIPADTLEHSSLNTTVARGPVMAAAKVAGIQITGFLTMLGI